MARPVMLLGVVVVSALVGCRRPPDPPTREHPLKDLGLTITLPGDWRGGRIEGAGFVFASHSADCSLSFNDGLVGIAASEAGARTFLEREGAVVLSTGAQRIGKWDGFVGTGTLRSDSTTRTYFGLFPGPRGDVWTVLTTRGRPVADADALWQSIIVSPR